MLSRKLDKQLFCTSTKTSQNYAYHKNQLKLKHI